MDESDAIEFWAERAAIVQYDGGLSQPDAQYYAAVFAQRYAERHGIPLLVDDGESLWMRDYLARRAACDGRFARKSAKAYPT